jgi:DNA-binding NtrC family response regulator
MDEVGEMSLRMQAMLLRFLETGEIQRVGSDRRLPPVDVRVITATNRRLLDAMADKTFREDLYYRLNVVHIEIPPLRDRREDVPPLLRHFLGAFAESHRRTLPELTTEAMEQLMAYRWPGNVRELKNVAERLVLKSKTGRIEADMLPAEVLRCHRQAPSHAVASPAVPAVHEELFARLTVGLESFWSAVYEPFMVRDLTRQTLRELVSLGLQQTRGNYRMLVTMFNMQEKDYKRFLHFLRKYQCHVPFQEFRMMRTAAPERLPQHDEQRRSA